MNELTKSELLQARMFAITQARSLHPDQPASPQTTYGPLSQAKAVASVETVIATADKIFNWITNA